MTTIDRRLKLVVPIYDEAGKTLIAQAHSTPLSFEVFKRHIVILSQVYAQLLARGLVLAGGPKASLQILENIATADGTWDDPPGRPGAGVRNNLIEELRRLTNVAIKKDGAWAQVPLVVAAQQGAISARDAWEVESLVVFFTVASEMLPAEQRAEVLEAALNVSGALLSSSSTTEFFASLRTSIATDSSGEKSHAPAHGGPGRATATRDGKPSSVPA